MEGDAMEKKSGLTKFLAVAGTVLVWLPIVAPVLFSAAFLARSGRFRLDYLMPAELFLFALGGGLLLFWAATRARSRRAIIGWGVAAAAGILAAGQGLAVVSGLASGETEPAGFWWALVLASLALYTLAVAAIGVGGVLLLRDLFKTEERRAA
jgi:hypothetical protein